MGRWYKNYCLYMVFLELFCLLYNFFSFGSSIAKLYRGPLLKNEFDKEVFISWVQVYKTSREARVL
jgi:hypothetical protein